MQQKKKARPLFAALLAAVLMLALLPLPAYATAPTPDVSLTVNLNGHANFAVAVADALSKLGGNAPSLNAVTTLTITGEFDNSGSWTNADRDYLVNNFPSLYELDMKAYTGAYAGYAFGGLSGDPAAEMTRVRLPANVTLSACMFACCPNLTTLVCGDGAFQDNVIDLRGAAAYGEETFRECHRITQARLPADIDIAEDGVFYDCSNLTTLVCGDGTPEQGLIDLTGYTGSSYGRSLFVDCSAIGRVRLPASPNISNNMFKNCTSLAEITFVGGNAPSVGYNAFDNVSANGTLYYPEGAARYDTAFDGTGLASWNRVAGDPRTIIPAPAPAEPAPAAEGVPHVCYFGDWQYSNEHHWKRCSCMALSDYAPHVFNSARVCTVCGYGAKPKKVNPQTGVYDSGLPQSFSKPLLLHFAPLIGA